MIKEINDNSMPEFSVYSKLLENQLKRIYEPSLGLFIAESPMVIRRAFDAGYLPESFLLDPEEMQKKDIGELISEYVKTVPVYLARKEILSTIPGFHLTRGLLCTMKRKPLPNAEIICKEARRICVLEKVMNPTNVGSVFRSASALGMDAVLLTEGSSDPLYRRAARVSMGTVFQIPWTFIKDVGEIRSYGFKTVSMALRNNSVDISDERLRREKRLAVLMGSEETGLEEKTIDESDYVVKIPMYHHTDSLNVAAAAGIAFWELCKR